MYAQNEMQNTGHELIANAVPNIFGLDYQWGICADDDNPVAGFNIKTKKVLVSPQFLQFLNSVSNYSPNLAKEISDAIICHEYGHKENRRHKAQLTEQWNESQADLVGADKFLTLYPTDPFRYFSLIAASYTITDEKFNGQKYTSDEGRLAQSFEYAYPWLGEDEQHVVAKSAIEIREAVRKFLGEKE